jgi:hypothetical protein
MTNRVAKLYITVEEKKFALETAVAELGEIEISYKEIKKKYEEMCFMKLKNQQELIKIDKQLEFAA